MDIDIRYRSQGTQDTYELDDLLERNQRWLDQYLYAEGEALKSLVSNTVAYLENHEAITQPRQRRRRPQDQASFEAAVEAVVVNLAYSELRPAQSDGVVVPRRTGTRRTRYDNSDLNIITLNRVTRGLGECRVLELRVGNRGGAASSIRATPWFLRRIQEAGVTLSDFGRRPGEEVVVLSRRSARDWSQGRAGGRQRPEWVDYRDIPVSDALRAEVRALNDFLRWASITFRGDPVHPVDRVLKRHFSLLPSDMEVRFDQNGRLFGGHWQEIAKIDRAHLRVSGEPVADIDYKNMFARLAYAEAGASPPEGDLYDLTGILKDYDNASEEHRKGVKEALSSLFFGGAAGASSILGKLPPGTTARVVRSALAKKHPALKRHFRSTIGFRLMFTESRVLLRSLQILMEQGIVALPMHDGLMVPESRVAEAEEAMQAAARDIVGCGLPVVRKPIA